MICPKCGAKLPRKSLVFLIPLTALVILSFGVSLFILPFELFFLFAFVLLIGLRQIEKHFTSIDKQEVRCPVCSHTINVAPTY